MMTNKRKTKPVKKITKAKIKDLFTKPSPSKIVAVLVALVVIGSGIFLLVSNAAGFFASSEPEAGTLSGNAKLVSDTTATGSKAVQFTAPESTTPPPPPPPSGTLPTGCAPHPSQCSYPDASNTGPTGTLTVMDLAQGYMDVTVAGTIIENKDIRGCLIIKAPNVTVRNSKVSCPNYSVIYNSRDYYSGGGLVIEDTLITCETTQGTGISEYGFTARRVEISGCENGLSMSDTATLEDSYIHDLYEGSVGHADGIQMAGTPSNVVIKHNSILVPGTTSAVNWTGQTTSVRIENNMLGGGSYTVYCPRVTIPTGAYKVLSNRFVDGMERYGLTDSCGGGDVEFTGNYKDSNLAAVSAQ